jgi:hypothetical protein
VTGGLRGKKRFAFLLFFKKKILRLKMKYRKEIISGIVHSVSPRGIRLVDSPLPRLYLFPRPLPRVAEISALVLSSLSSMFQPLRMLSMPRREILKSAFSTLKNF